MLCLSKRRLSRDYPEVARPINANVEESGFLSAFGFRGTAADEEIPGFRALWPPVGSVDVPDYSEPPGTRWAISSATRRVIMMAR